jgi:hypothetical protein
MTRGGNTERPQNIDKLRQGGMGDRKSPIFQSNSAIHSLNLLKMARLAVFFTQSKTHRRSPQDFVDGLRTRGGDTARLFCVKQ